MSDNILEMPGSKEAVAADNHQAPPIQASDISNSKRVICKCGCEHFVPAFKFRHLSSIMSSRGQEELIPMQGFVCMECRAEVSDAQTMPNNPAPTPKKSA